MNLFALSTEDGVADWYMDLSDNLYKTLDEFLIVFKEKLGEKGTKESVSSPPYYEKMKLKHWMNSTKYLDT